jgi:D-alanine--D-alanine ligase
MDNTPAQRQRRTRLGLIFGGVGPEHEASLSSARAVLDHLDPSRYDIIQLAIEKSGEWLAGSHAWEHLYIAADPRLLPTAIRGIPIRQQTRPVRKLGARPTKSQFSAIDVVFPLVHGQGGEDGTLQTLCAFLGKPFVGCDSVSSAIGFNKWATKQVTSRFGIASPRGILVRADYSDTRIVRLVNTKFGRTRLIVKPAASGSSFGVHSVVGGWDAVPAVRDARKYSSDVIIEQFLEAEEIAVGIVGNGNDLKTAPPALDGPGIGAVASYFDKYINQDSPVRCPTGLGSAIDAAATDIARRTYAALRCSGLARIDLFYSPKSRKIYLNEVNTMPALAANCAFPTVMAAAGLPLPQLLDHLIEFSLKRPRRLRHPAFAL